MGKPIALVIEDEYDISIIFARALRQAGYETSIVRSGDTALAWLSAEVPDLVILDLNLPRLPGTEILEHIREDPRLKDVHIIVATAFPRLAETLRGEVDWTLIKPVNFGQLRNLAERFSPDTSKDKEPDPAAGDSEEE
jgi:DNA-binding response OmpR family regulator